MAKINVPRAELTRLCGLPADADDETLSKAMAELLAAAEARKAQSVAAAAEQQLVAEDKRIVAAAINDGRLPVDRAAFWLDACARDRSNRQIIASLAPGLQPAEKIAADSQAEATHAKLMARLGLGPEPRTVAASFGDWGDTYGAPSPYATPETPAPVLLSKGTAREDYSREEKYQDFIDKLGLSRRLGVPKPPPGDSWYVPSPNDHVEFKNGEWVDKAPYKEVSGNG